MQWSRDQQEYFFPDSTFPDLLVYEATPSTTGCKRGEPEENPAPGEAGHTGSLPERPTMLYYKYTHTYTCFEFASLTLLPKCLGSWG